MIYDTITFIKALALLLFSTFSLETTTSPNNSPIDNINEKRLEKLYIQYGKSINPTIISDNPTRDIVLLNEHAKALEHEQIKSDFLLLKIKEGKGAVYFACFLLGIVTAGDLAILIGNLLSKEKTNIKLLIGIPASLIALLVGYGCKKLYYYPDQRIEQLTKDIEKLKNDIIRDKIIVAELEKHKITPSATTTL